MNEIQISPHDIRVGLEFCYLFRKILIPNFETWEAENSMTMSWMLHFMEPEIRNHFPFNGHRSVFDAVQLQKMAKRIGFLRSWLV